jgi:predicted nucleic acid-binding protein
MRFVDTSFWVALFFARDAHHSDARELWRHRQQNLVTTNHVLGETWTFLVRRRGHADAVRAVDALTGSPGTTVMTVAGDDEASAWQWLRRHDEREYSFVDATSFAVMRRRRLTDALAFDGDFSAAGFVEVRPT